MEISAYEKICFSMGIDNDNCPVCPLSALCSERPEAGSDEYPEWNRRIEEAAAKAIKGGFKV